MKRFSLVILLLSSLLLLSSCQLKDIFENNPKQKEVDSSDDGNTDDNDPEDDEVIQTEKIAFNKILSRADLSYEYDIKGESLNTYRNKDDTVTSYVNIEEFAEFLEGGIKQLNVDKTNVLKFSFTILVEEDYIDIIGSDEYTYEMIFDPESNKISFNDFDFLDNLNVEMKSEYVTDVTQVSFDVPNQSYAHEINLNEYDYEIIVYDNNYYLPLYLANLFFSGSNMNVYEMENKIYIIDNSTDISIITNKYKSNVFYGIDGIQNHTAKYLALYFDNFYGLKDYHGVERYKDVLNEFMIDKQTTPNKFYTQIDEFLRRRDDLHTSLVTAGYRKIGYVNSNSYLDDEKINGFINAYRKQSCNNNTNEITYSIHDNIMIITINAFTLKTKDLIAPIMEKAKNYDDIAFDLSCNTGGSLIAVLEVLVYLTDQPIPLSYMNPITDTEIKEYYQSTTSKYLDKDYYLRTSEVTFSAANLFTSIFNDMNLGPTIGSKTSGGAAAITYAVLPDGAIIVNSSNMVLMNEKKEIIEDGIDVGTKIGYDAQLWLNVKNFKNILKGEPTIKFNYDNLTNSIIFNISVDTAIEDFEVEEFILTFKNFKTGEVVKEYVFTDFVFGDAFEKPNQLEDYAVILNAKYKYKSVYSNEFINLAEIDKDFGEVGDYIYREVTADESFTLNTLSKNDQDVVKLNLTKAGLYSIKSVSENSYSNTLIYDASYNLLGHFYEKDLSEGIYYVAITNDYVGDHEYIIKNLVDDNESNTIINLVNGENQNSVLRDFSRDNETFEFTLNEDKIIKLSFDKSLDYRILKEDGSNFNSISEYSSVYDYTFKFPKGTYGISVYDCIGLVNFTANVMDANSDLYTDDFSNKNGFGQLLLGENQIVIDYMGDVDIYYIDLIEKGVFGFNRGDIYINRIDENGNYYQIKPNEVIELNAGRHYFSINKYTRNSSSDILVFNQIIDESDEDNHLTINIGEQVTTILANKSDKDYFDITISEDGLYKIEFYTENFSTYFELYNEENVKIIFSNYRNEVITLSEGKYTFLLYQNGYYVNNISKATLKISKE